MDRLEAKVARLSSLHLFPKIYNAAHLTLALCPAPPTLTRFTSQLVSMLRKFGLTAQTNRGTTGRVLVDDVILLQVISEQDSLEQTAKALLEHLKSTGFPLVGYVLQFGNHIRWKRIQITERYAQLPNSQAPEEEAIV